MQVSSNIYATVFDARHNGTFGGSDSCTGNTCMHIRTTSETPTDRFGMFNYQPQGETDQYHGYIFNRRAIDGKNDHDVNFELTVVNDKMSYSQAFTSTSINTDFYTSTVPQTCSSLSGSNYDTSSSVFKVDGKNHRLGTVAISAACAQTLLWGPTPRTRAFKETLRLIRALLRRPVSVLARRTSASFPLPTLQSS